MIKSSMPTLQFTRMSDTLNTSTMQFFTVKEWEENFDELFARVENGERLGIVKEDGTAAVFVPADDELLKMYTDHEEGS